MVLTTCQVIVVHQAPRAWVCLLLSYISEEHGYRRGSIDKTLFIKKNKKDIMLVQVYVDDIIFGSTKKSWCDEFETLMKGRFQMSSMGELTFFLGLQAITPMETKMALTKDEESADVDVNPKVSHLIAVKRIFKYLKGKPNLGLWYPRESPFALEAFSDSDYAGANLDRKSTTGGCQFLGRRLISWQCKKQTIVATSTTEAEYVAAANCYGQILWIQNQLLDYGFNFMNTKIHIDNESTICIVKNPVFHSKTKHIKIRHHFIRDAYEKKLIQVQKIHTENNVADLLNKEHLMDQGLLLLMLRPTRINVSDLLHLSTSISITRIDNFGEELKDNKQTNVDDELFNSEIGNEGENLGERKMYLKLHKRKRFREAYISSKWKVKVWTQEEMDVGDSSGIEIAFEKLKVSQRKGKEVLEEQPQPKRSKKQIREEEASLAEIARIQAQEAAEIERKVELQRLVELADKRLNDELEMTKQQRKRATEDYAKKMVELVEKRRREIREQKLKAKKNKPMTQVEQRNYMMNYVQFERTIRSIENFIPMDSEKEKESLKRSGETLQGAEKKKQKVLDVEDIPIPESAKFVKE
ncbi:putative ribonuclease H-like domain-containing protein [Tanacetum coccineum]